MTAAASTAANASQFPRRAVAVGAVENIAASKIPERIVQFKNN
jgi:hypothetical protein